MPDVKPERSHWRDEKISQFHRELGWDCPAIDIDFLLVEFDRFIPRALIEYKHEYSSIPELDKPQIKVLRNLANMASLPAFIVRYADDLTWFEVQFANIAAKEILPKRIRISRKSFAALLYKLRGRDIPAEVLNKLEENYHD